jgi:hypothetical protein
LRAFPKVAGVVSVELAEAALAGKTAFVLLLGRPGLKFRRHFPHPLRPLGLLRACRERPRRSTADKRDELAPSHVPLAAHSHCFTEPLGRGGLRLSANPSYSAAPHAYYFT